MKPNLVSALLLALGAGCGSGSTVQDVGRYHVDQEQFAVMLVDHLVATGKVPGHSRKQVLQQLRTSRFDLELAADGTFSATQAIMADTRTYAGRWKRNGSSFVLEQTHENGAKIADSMSGTWDDGRLELTHVSDEGTLRFVLVHESLAAPGR